MKLTAQRIDLKKKVKLGKKYCVKPIPMTNSTGRERRVKNSTPKNSRRKETPEKAKAPAPRIKIDRTCCSRESRLVKTSETVSDKDVRMKVRRFDIS